MRIISQDKTIDVEYNNNNFIISAYNSRGSEKRAIWATGYSDGEDHYLVMGNYKNLETAKEVMREMRTYYHNLMHYNMLFMKDKDDEQLSPLFEMPQDEGEEEEQ